jgi:hypothetical protein
MKRMIYQVAVGKPSKLYERCIQSVSYYCEKYDIHHLVQKEPILRIKPDPFNMNRSKESYEKHGGFLPIYEKENAFGYLDDYDQIAIIDADIFIRGTAPNIFDDFDVDKAFGAVVEREMPITQEYKKKIIQYSAMQYNRLNGKVDFKHNELGFEFFNMGMILLNTQKFKPFLKGQSPREFIERAEFKDFVDGVGAWKWSTDQTLLNYFVKKHQVPVKKMHWKWNGLYTANTNIQDCHFVHFFLKDKLPNKGEDVAELMRKIND